MSPEEVIGSFNPNDRDDVALVKQKAKDFLQVLNDQVPEGRRKAIAVTHIEEAAMMAVKAIYS